MSYTYGAFLRLRFFHNLPQPRQPLLKRGTRFQWDLLADRLLNGGNHLRQHREPLHRLPHLLNRTCKDYFSSQ
ncbi:MAG: hypothetical protein JW963_19455 [Anaerolineales bacterium]|nr:hypothetical protein [Anaerolineales bacterium]